VCDECRDRVPPHRWNRFSAGLPDDIADHIVDGLVRPRRAMLRAAFGDLPWGGLAAAVLGGCLGASWLLLALLEPETAGGVRLGRGVVGLWQTVPVAAVFALTMHALQPDGPGSPAPLRRSLAMVATAGIPTSAAALGGAIVAFLGPLFGAGILAAQAAAGASAATGLVSAVLAGRGLAMRRGASPALGALAAAAGVVVSLLVVGLLIWIRLHPPWGDAWDAAGG